MSPARPSTRLQTTWRGLVGDLATTTSPTCGWGRGGGEGGRAGGAGSHRRSRAAAPGSLTAPAPHLHALHPHADVLQQRNVAPRAEGGNHGGADALRAAAATAASSCAAKPGAGESSQELESPASHRRCPLCAAGGRAGAGQGQPDLQALTTVNSTRFSLTMYTAAAALTKKAARSVASRTSGDRSPQRRQNRAAIAAAQSCGRCCCPDAPLLLLLPLKLLPLLPPTLLVPGKGA